MSMTAYEPPAQGLRGQLVDAATILALIFATLFLTTFITQRQAEDTAAQAEPAPTRQLSELPVTAAERQQFHKMIDTETVDLETVNSSVEANRPAADKYPIDVPALVGTAAVIVAYLVFVYAVSFREYREVIYEKFGPPEGGVAP
ncbi:MAG: hypothetical protein ACRDPK_20835 [Carbonactinosporaceae bacterium]